MKTTITVVIFLFFIATSFIQTQPGGLKASIERGKGVYEGMCLSCHQPDGAGVPTLNPPLAKTKYVTGDKKALVKVILKGLPGGTVAINGEKFNNPMPPMESMYNDQEVADVLTYIRNSFGNKASQVTAAEVKAVRAANKSN